MGTTSNGAMAPPIWLAISMTPAMLARCVVRNHREMTMEAFGKAPASPAPNENLVRAPTLSQPLPHAREIVR
jgi:hypothetical protein